jgi:RNA polymerase sigma-70 factor, ECF subfamily
VVNLEQELEWIRKSQKGDLDAFALLIVRYQRFIHSITYRMTGSFSDAQDLAQETFIRAFQQIQNFQGQARFSSWVYRIAVNACLNHRKAKTRLEELHEEWSYHTETESGPEETSQVQQALLKLKPKERAAILLTVYEGLNHAEASEVLGCSETTVSWRIFSARKKLKRLLAVTQEHKQSTVLDAI